MVHASSAVVAVVLTRGLWVALVVGRLVEGRLMVADQNRVALVIVMVVAK